MTKSELIAALADLEDDDEVFITQPTHNHWGQVRVVKAQDADFYKVRYSEYNESLILVGDSDPQEKDKDVFVISDSRYW